MLRSPQLLQSRGSHLICSRPNSMQLPWIMKLCPLLSTLVSSPCCECLSVKPKENVILKGVPSVELECQLCSRIPIRV